MLESAEPVPSAPLAATIARRYNSRGTAEDTNAMRLNMCLFGRLEGAIGHARVHVEIEAGSRDLRAPTPTGVMQAGCEPIDAGTMPVSPHGL
jgi:hypothetical protein